MWIHLINVGASICTNAIRSNRLKEHGVSNLQELENKRDERIYKTLVDYVSKAPEEASAELNTCLELLKEGYGRGLQQRVYLIYSDTWTGELCAKVLCQYFKELSRKWSGRLSCEKKKVENLGNEGKFNVGLANLLRTLIEISLPHKQEKNIIFIHATGGFKPEVSIATIASNLPVVGAPVFYVHETFKKRIRIPAMPLEFREIKGFRELMNCMCERKSIPEAQIRILGFDEKTVDKAIRLGWLDQKDGEICISAMGELFWKELRAIERRKGGRIFFRS